jgi:hypothetical protein
MKVITNSVLIVFGVDYLPVASYANAAESHQRYLILTFHLIWISTVWSFFIFFICMVISRPISQIFGLSGDYLDWAENLLFYGNIGTYLIFIRFNAQIILQTLGLAA